MANVNRPNGGVPIRSGITAAPYNGQGNMYYLPATNGTATFVGDPVSFSGTAGAAGVVVSGVSVEGMPGVVQTVAGDSNIIGFVVGFLPNYADLAVKYRLASTARIAIVVDDPYMVFEMQDDSVGSDLSILEVGQNADLIIGTGSTSTGISAAMIDSSTTTTGTANLRILRASPRPDNSIPATAAGTGNLGKWEVMILEHFLKTPTGV